MTAEPARHLQLVDSAPEGFDGEVTSDNLRLLLGRLTELENTVAGQLVTIRSQAGIIGRLERSLEEADPSTHPQAAEITKLIDRWRKATGHPKAKASRDRFDAIKARLKDGYSVEQLELAIDGLGAFPFVQNGQRVREGTAAQRHDRLGIAMGGGEDVERFANLGALARKNGWAVAA